MVATARLLLCFVLGLSGLFGVATMACAPGAAGERPAAPGNPATTVLRCARLIDGTGGKVVDDAVVVIVGEKILAAGPRATTPIPSGAQIVVYEGKTIMPGIISDHSHVGIVNGVDVGAASYSRSNILRQLRQYEAYGVTTVTALGLNGALFDPIRAEMHAGKTPGADLFGVDRGIGVPDGAPPAGLLPVGPDQLFRPATPEQAREAVQAMASRQTDLVKLWLDDFGGSVPSKMKPEIYDAVIDESHKHGLRVAAHIHDLDDAKAILRAGADILAHGVRDKPVDSEFLAEMKSRGAVYVATLSLDEATFVYADGPAWMKDPFFQHALQPQLRDRLADPVWRDKVAKDPKSAAARASLNMNLRNLKAVFDAGVAVGFGTDSGATPVRIPGFAEHRELSLMVQAGLTPMEALTIATHHAAAALALSDRGVLLPGKRADLLVLDRDPTEDIDNTRSIRAVWHRGHLASGPVETFDP
jgi:imidazolonepropionase-like amidohydrolase